jgi:hypothetical protein
MEIQKELTRSRKALAGLICAMGIALSASSANALTITGGVGVEGGSLVQGIGNQCLEIGGIDSTAPAAVHGWSCNNNQNQLWTITNGLIQKVNNGRAVCLSTAGGALTAGSLVETDYCVAGAKDQVWNVKYNGTIVNEYSGLCLDWGGSFNANGVQMAVQVCDGGQTQEFWLR